MLRFNRKRRIKKWRRSVQDWRPFRRHNRTIHWRLLISAAHFSRYCLNLQMSKWKMEIDPCRTRSELDDKKFLPIQWFGECTLSRSPLVMAVLQRSLPARSTRLILLVMLCSCSSPSTNSDWAKEENESGIFQTAHWKPSYLSRRIRTPTSRKGKTRNHTCVWVMTRVNTEWDLELLSFIPVAAVARCLFPRFSQPFKRKNTVSLSQSASVHAESISGANSSSLLHQCYF